MRSTRLCHLMLALFAAASLVSPAQAQTNSTTISVSAGTNYVGVPFSSLATFVPPAGASVSVLNATTNNFNQAFIVPTTSNNANGTLGVIVSNVPAGGGAVTMTGNQTGNTGQVSCINPGGFSLQFNCASLPTAAANIPFTSCNISIAGGASQPLAVGAGAAFSGTTFEFNTSTSSFNLLDCTGSSGAFTPGRAYFFAANKNFVITYPGGSTASPGAIALSGSSFTSAPGGTVNVNLTRSAPAGAGGANVTFATSNGTAVNGTDYTGVNTTVNFTSGSNTSTVPVTILPGAGLGKSFSVSISNPDASSVLGAPATATVTIAGPNTLVISPANSTTVVGGRQPIQATLNGAAVNVTLSALTNASVATIQGQVLVGAAAGTTNYTATANPGGQTATGSLTVVTGATPSSLIVGTNTAGGFTMQEGDQRQMFAQVVYTVSGASQPPIADVSTSCVWTVTPSGSGDNGSIVSFEPATAGNLTCTKGLGNSVNIAAIFRDPGTQAVVFGMRSVTTNLPTNPLPTLAINPSGQPTGSTGLTGNIPVGGWVRLFESRVTYPQSNFSRFLGAGEAQWAVTAGNALLQGGGTPTTIQPVTAAAFGKAELQSAVVTFKNVTTANTGPGTLSVTYAGTTAAPGTFNFNVTNYTLTGNLMASLSPGLAGDKNVIAGGMGLGYARPITVIANFMQLPSTTPFSYPLYTSPNSINNGGIAGTLSLYLPAQGTNSVNSVNYFPAGTGVSLATARTTTDKTIKFLTSAISPVGYSQMVQSITTTGTNGPIGLRVQQSTHTGADGGQINAAGDTFLQGVTSTIWTGDRDVNRFATIPGVTLDQGTTFSFSSVLLNGGQSPAGPLTTGLPVGAVRDSAFNTRLLGSYKTGALNGVQEDVTDLFGTQIGADTTNTFVPNNGQAFGNFGQLGLTDGVHVISSTAFPLNGSLGPQIPGQKNGQVLVITTASTAGQKIFVAGKYPHTGPGLAGGGGNSDASGAVTIAVP